MKKYSELTPEEINALCAEVDGQKVYRDRYGKPSLYLMWQPLPNYLKDMNLCMGLLSDYVNWEVSYNEEYSPSNTCYLPEVLITTYADTSQEAIIKAVLLANNLVEEE